MDFAFNLDEDPEEGNDMLCRELIGLVRGNELLWKTRLNSYKDQQRKALTWCTIGQSLTKPMDGPSAEKFFYRLRQKFGRELRKMNESAPRSGAGAGEPTFSSNWALFNDLDFLKDAIKPRPTTTSMPVRCSTPSTGGERQLQLTTCGQPKSAAATTCRPPLPSPTASQSESSVWNCSVDDMFLESSSNSNAEVLSPGSSGGSADNSRPGTPLSSTQPVFLAKRPKHKVPAPDSSHVAKKKAIDLIDSAILQHSSNLSALSNKLFEALDKEKTSVLRERNVDLEIAAHLNTLDVTLNRVPVEKRVDCLIDLVQVARKYLPDICPSLG